MKIIGEKINSTRSQVKKAVAERDAAFIQNLAKAQVEAGAYWLDVNAGMSPEKEAEDLVWLVHTVQEVVDVPLCLDSANPPALHAAIKEVRHTPLINSISGERNRIEGILPIVASSGAGVIALTASDRGMPVTVEDRLTVMREIMPQVRAAGVSDDRVYVDPLVMAVATNTQCGLIGLECFRAIHAEFPEVHFTCGLSNISFGLPARSPINQAFLVLAMQAGLDTAIMDPLDKEVRKIMMAAEVVLGRDRHCLKYIRAFRSGLFGQQAAKA
jgi:5-methyltetrahydrofolate--homocysteine methyltransferase